MPKAKSTTKPEKKTEKKATKPAKKTVSQAKQNNDATSLIGENTKFTLTLAAVDISKAKQAALQKAQQQAKFEGFRQGKAPLSLVEERLGEARVRDLILEDLLSIAYTNYVREHKLLPLTDPAISIESMEEGKDWSFNVEIAETPAVELGNYEKIVADTKKKHELWQESTSKKKDEEPEVPEDVKRQQQISALLEAILDQVTIKVPELLLRKETEHALHEFSHQLEHMNISMEDYLEKVGKSMQDIQQEYAARSLMNLQVEFLLGAVVKAAKIQLPEKEVTDILAQVENPTPEQRQYVISSLLKQKAVDHLLTL